MQVKGTHKGIDYTITNLNLKNMNGEILWELEIDGDVNCHHEYRLESVVKFVRNEIDEEYS